MKRIFPVCFLFLSTIGFALAGDPISTAKGVFAFQNDDKEIKLQVEVQFLENVDLTVLPAKLYPKAKIKVSGGAYGEAGFEEQVEGFTAISSRGPLYVTFETKNSPLVRILARPDLSAPEIIYVECNDFGDHYGRKVWDKNKGEVLRPEDVGTFEVERKSEIVPDKTPVTKAVFDAVTGFKIEGSFKLRNGTKHEYTLVLSSQNKKLGYLKIGSQIIRMEIINNFRAGVLAIDAEFRNNIMINIGHQPESHKREAGEIIFCHIFETSWTEAKSVYAPYKDRPDYFVTLAMMNPEQNAHVKIDPKALLVDFTQSSTPVTGK